jgi:hypothetical protein
MAIGISGGKLTVPTSSAQNPLTTTTAGATGVLVLPSGSVFFTADSNGYAPAGGWGFPNGAGTITAVGFQTGASATVLEAAGNVPIGSSGGPSTLSLDPSGNTIYCVNPTDGNVQSVGITVTSGATPTVTFGTPSAAQTDPTWATAYAAPNVCVLVTQSGSSALFTGNSDGSISAFPVSAGTVSAASTVYTPPSTITASNVCDIGGIAADPTGQFLVTADSLDNKLFAFSIAIASGKVTLTSIGLPLGYGPMTNAAAVIFNAGGPILYAVNNQVLASNAAASTVYTYTVDSTGLTNLGSVPLPSASDSPMGLAVSK